MSKREVIYPSNTSQFLRGDATFATAGGGGSQAVSGSNGSFTFDTVTFGNLNGLSFYTSGGSMVGSYTVPVAGAAITVSDAATSGTIGRLAFSNLNGITLSLSTGAGGSHTIVGSYTVPTVTNSSWTVSDSATSGSVARLAFTNLNGVTLSLSSGAGGSHTIVGSHNALTSQSNQALSGSNGSFTFQTATFGNSNGFTFYTTNGSIVGQNAISTARASTDAIGLATAQTNVTWTANSAGLSFNAAGYAGTGTSATNASITLNSNGLAISVAAPGGGAAATYSNFFEPYYLDQNTATCSGSLSQLRLIPMSIPVNLSFGQVNYLASAAVANTGAGNTFQFRLTNVQSIAYSAVYTVQGTNLVDMFMFTRGTGGFSSELETINSTRNSFITNHSLTYRATVNHTAGSTGSVTLNQSQSMMVSYPMMTSGTATSVNPASTVTTWGMGYTTWTSTASTSVTNTYNTTNTASTSVATTHPGTTAWSSWKMAPLGFATSLTPGEYWLGMVRYSSTSSSSTFGSTIATAGTGASYTVTYNASSITRTGGLTFVGQTKSIASSLGWLGFVSANSMAPEQGLGSFSGTWASNTTYLNNAGNPAGAIAFSQILTEVSFCKQWLQMASNRI